MELFKNTNYDFLGKKWPFIIASLVLTAAGFGSWATKGLQMGIDFKGGANVYLRFRSDPPVEKIRSALGAKIKGEINVQSISGKPEVLVGTEIADEKELNANRQVIEETLRATFGDQAGKLDLNNSSVSQLADAIREPLQQASVNISEQDLQDTVQAIQSFRASRGGILSSLDELSGVKGVTPQFVAAIKDKVALGSFTILQTEVVGPKVGKDLQQQAILATLYALGGMLVYIAFRFEFIYGVAAVIAVFHDTLITLGLFSIFGYEVSLTVVAALLTLVGYSMNDTIVVFDRIRENLKLTRKDSLEDLINLSVNQTLSRTVLTSGLTLLTALSLFLFGGQVLKGFSFALVAGIIVGTYSSIFIASPILIFWQNAVQSKKAAAAPAKVASAPAKKAGK